METLTVNFYELQERNRRRTLVLILVFVVLLGVLGYSLDRAFFGGGSYALTFLALLVAGVQSFVGYFYGDRMALSATHARPARPEDPEERQLIHVVQEMAIAAGLPMPKVYVIEDPSPNAFATGRDPAHASVAATRGLLEMMNREELQAVMAHEMSHIRHRDILTMTMVTALAGAIVVLADMARRYLWYGGGRRRRRSSDRSDSGGGGGLFVLIALVLIILAPIVARLMALAVSRAREYLADAGAAELTRNPLALARALRKIAGAPPMQHVSQSTAHLFILDPRKSRINEKDSLWSNLWSTHPPLETRIRLLKRMAGTLGMGQDDDLA